MSHVALEEQTGFKEAVSQSRLTSRIASHTSRLACSTELTVRSSSARRAKKSFLEMLTSPPRVAMSLFCGVLPRGETWPKLERYEKTGETRLFPLLARGWKAEQPEARRTIAPVIFMMSLQVLLLIG